MEVLCSLCILKLILAEGALHALLGLGAMGTEGWEPIEH